MDENPSSTGASHMNRRDMLRRSAVVGGTLIWAAPVVQSMAPRAFASVVSPPDGDDPVCVYYAIKLDVEDGYELNNATTNNSKCLDEALLAQASGNDGTGFVKSWTGDGDGLTVYLDGRAEQVVGYSKCGETGCEPAQVFDESSDVAVFFPCPHTNPQGQAIEQEISNVQLFFCIPE